MKKIFFRVLLFVVIVLAADIFIGAVCKKLYKDSKDLFVSKLRYSMDSTKEDVLIFGSSRTGHHFIPEIIEQHIGLSVYNNGIDAADLLFSRIQLNETLKRYKPRLVVLESSPSSFYVPDARAGYKLLLPFYSRDTLIYNTLTKNHLFEKTKFISSIYPYNSTIGSLLKGMMKKEADLYKGYIPIYGTIDTNGLAGIVDKSYTAANLPVEHFAYLKDFIETCQRNQIMVIVISSPVFMVNRHHDNMVKQFHSFCARFAGVRYIDYTRHESIYGKPHLFKDNTHMNHEGAKLFSETVAKEINQLIAGKQSVQSSEVVTIKTGL